MQHEVANGWDPICKMRLPIVGTLYATNGYQWSGPYMQQTVTNGRDPICNMTLPIVGPYMQQKVTNGWDPICKMRLPMIRTLYAT